MAAIYNVPSVFVCENNLYGASTNIGKTLKLKNIADRAQSYGIEGMIADGMDVIDSTLVTTCPKNRHGAPYNYRLHIFRGDIVSIKDAKFY